MAKKGDDSLMICPICSMRDEQYLSEWMKQSPNGCNPIPQRGLHPLGLCFIHSDRYCSSLMLQIGQIINESSPFFAIPTSLCQFCQPHRRLADVSVLIPGRLCE